MQWPWVCASSMQRTPKLCVRAYPPARPTTPSRATPAAISGWTRSAAFPAVDIQEAPGAVAAVVVALGLSPSVE